MPVTAATIFLSAFLLFLVQPIIAKEILPWFGGSAAVWTTCLLFFQVVLLCGYAYAHALARWLGARRQAVVHSLLLAGSLALLPIIPGPGWRPTGSADPTGEILLLLGATIGLPYFLLSSSGPLLQSWLAHRAAPSSNSRTVYRLFALSNIGSLAGLVVYPFAVEPMIGTSNQARVWSSAYLLFCLGSAVCAWRPRGAPDGAPDGAVADGNANPPAPVLRDFLRWIGLAALGSSLLLATSNHLAQNIASIPFLWILPLSVYLLSFVIAFEGRGGRGWYSRRFMLVPTMLACVAMAWALVTHSGVLNIYIAVPLFCVGLLLACVVCHGEVATSKPATAYLTHFYLSLATGGAIGALAVSLVAPHIFDYYWETPIAMAILALVLFGAELAQRAPDSLWRWAVAFVLGVGAAWALLALTNLLPGHDDSDLATKWSALWSHWRWAVVVAVLVVLAILARLRLTLAVAVAALLCTVAYGWDFYRFITEDNVFMVRDFYGTLRVKPVGSGIERSLRLMHGVILHGEQFLDPERAYLATTYYSPTSGIGRTIDALRRPGVALSAGSIGLGTGTLTAYARAGDRWQIFEIDPEVVNVARTRFRYLHNSLAPIQIILGDARLSLEDEVHAGVFARPEDRFDVLSVDAFSSDAIPVHLITREALGIYAQAIKPDGVVAFHVSNRYLNLAPVVAQIAADAGFECVEIEDVPDDLLTYSTTEWVLVTRNKTLLADPRISGFSEPIAPKPGLRMWTDQFNNLFQILR